MRSADRLQSDLKHYAEGLFDGIRAGVAQVIGRRRIVAADRQRIESIIDRCYTELAEAVHVVRIERPTRRPRRRPFLRLIVNNTAGDAT